MACANTNLGYEQIDKIFCSARDIFFIGIGGISMSALAHYSLGCGKRVFGYDMTRNDACAMLEKRCYIKYCSTPDSTSGMDLVIYSTAIDESNLEYKNAKRLGIPLISRANFLGYIMSRHKCRLAICGAHGKSTTTAMLGHIYNVAQRSPCVFCGAVMRGYDSAFLQGDGAFICEACEYLDAFLSLCPDEIGVTGIDFDHPDYFKNESDAICSFQKFVSGARLVYLNADNSACMGLKHDRIITFGIKNDADYMAKIVHGVEKNQFLVYYRGKELCTCELDFLGEHFVYDALLAFAIAHQNGIDIPTICSALSSFEGTKRRMELVLRLDGVPIYEDYAHHPTEIKASLNALKEMGYKRVLCIFQPHTYSRTFMLLERFMTCFDDAHLLALLPTYSAREKNAFGLDDLALSELLGATYINNVDKVVDFIKNSNADSVVLMGAGDLLGLRDFLVKNCSL